MNFRALKDTGAAVTAVSARVWQRCSSNLSLNLGPPNHDSITTVDGCLLKVIGRVMLPFAIGSKLFPFEAYVIQDLTFDVILGRNFFEKFSAKIDFDEGMIRFKHMGKTHCLLIPIRLLSILMIVVLNLFVLCMLTQPSPFHHSQKSCLLYTSPSPRDGLLSRMPSSA